MDSETQDLGNNQRTRNLYRTSKTHKEFAFRNKNKHGITLRQTKDNQELKTLRTRSI